MVLFIKNKGFRALATAVVGRQQPNHLTVITNTHINILFLSFAVALAVAVPTIGPFISLIGALCFSLLGIIVPVLIEFSTFWHDVTVWMVTRNVCLIFIGILALVFGTKDSIADILKETAPVVAQAVNSTMGVAAQ